MSNLSEERRREQLRLAQRRTRLRRQQALQQLSRENQGLAQHLSASNAAVEEVLAFVRELLLSCGVTDSNGYKFQRLAELEAAHQQRMTLQAETPLEIQSIPASTERRESERSPSQTDMGARSETPYSSSVEMPASFEFDLELDDEDIARFQQRTMALESDPDLESLDQLLYTYAGRGEQQQHDTERLAAPETSTSTSEAEQRGRRRNLRSRARAPRSPRDGRE